MSESQERPAGSDQASQSTAERRRHKRFLEGVRVRYRDLEGQAPGSWGHSRNLSLGGLCLVGGVVPVGCHLALEIHIEDETPPVLALGRVVRLTDQADGDCEAGVEFLWVSEEDRANLARLASYFQVRYGTTGDLEG